MGLVSVGGTNCSAFGYKADSLIIVSGTANYEDFFTHFFYARTAQSDHQRLVART